MRRNATGSRDEARGARHECAMMSQVQGDRHAPGGYGWGWRGARGRERSACSASRVGIDIYGIHGSSRPVSAGMLELRP
jgi:hypothetical protein